MTTQCRVCLKPGGDCSACVRDLFDTDTAPVIDVDLARLHTLALSMVGKTSLSGVQRKISVGLVTDRMTLQVAIAGGRFILKPQASVFPQLPENEHLTMRLAHLFGLEIAPCGLFPLADGSAAYVVRRFDRTGDGRKVRAEDFCQLMELSLREKYQSSAERCLRTVRRYATEPGVESLKLFRLFVFSYWVGNGDLHLKNIALVTDASGVTRLSPAFDLVSTLILIPDDELALPVAGKKSKVRPNDWLALAADAGIPPRAAKRVLAQPAAVLTGALELISASSLPDDMKSAYAATIQERSQTIAVP